MLTANKPSKLYAVAVTTNQILIMSNQSNTFDDLIAAIVQDFESVGYKKTNDHTRPAYFETLGARFGLSAKSVKGIWESWLYRRGKGKGMFDAIAG